MNKKDFRRSRKRVEVSVGESVRIVRELQGLSQNELSKLTGIPQSTISAMENDRVKLGVERAKVIARALKCHPAVLVFPGWELDKESAAQAACADVEHETPAKNVAACTATCCPTRKPCATSGSGCSISKASRPWCPVPL